MTIQLVFSNPTLCLINVNNKIWLSSGEIKTTSKNSKREIKSIVNLTDNEFISLDKPCYNLTIIDIFVKNRG